MSTVVWDWKGRMVGFVAMEWRLRLVVFGVALAILPGLEREWFGVAATAVCGGLVMGMWAWAAPSVPRLGLGVGYALLGVLVILYALSQWPNGLVRAPVYDWLTAWLVVGGGACVVAIVSSRIAVSRCRRERGLGDQERDVVLRTVVASLVLVGALCLLGCGFELVVGDGDGRLRFRAGTNEIEPLPATLRLVAADSCASSGSSGNCTAAFVVANADRQPRPVAVSRLARALDTQGWNVATPTNNVHSWCRRVGGLLHWTDHCLWFYDQPESPGTSPTTPDTVTVYIDNG